MNYCGLWIVNYVLDFFPTVFDLGFNINGEITCSYRPKTFLYSILRGNGGNLAVFMYNAIKFTFLPITI